MRIIAYLKAIIEVYGPLKKNFRHVLLDTLAAIYVAFYVFLYSVLISISPIMVLAFKTPPFDYTFVVKRWTFSFRLQKNGLTSGERVSDGF